jgi:class 3 adenylate cyclase
MRLCYLFQANAQAWEYARKAAPLLDAVAASLAPGLFHFYDSLIRLSMLADTPGSERQAMLKAVAANQKKLRTWAKYAPMNYQHKSDLVEAERARVLGKDGEAREYYSRAVTLARDNQFVNEEALACELAGRFYLEQNDPLLAKIYLWEAHHAYQRWGAIAKVKDLEARYAQMFVLAPQSGPKTAIASPLSTPKPREAAALDLTSVVKASQAISGEIMLDKLLAAMMNIIIENAGAQSGYLLLERRGQWRIEAEGAIDQNRATVMQSGPIERNVPAPLPATIINFVVHTRESVVLNDATHDGPFAQDPYIVAHQPKSVLCAPLLNQGRLAGILYLENNLTRGAFTEERLEVLRLLSAQAAISLNNARLYADLAELNTAYERFVPREFLQLLNQASVVQIKLGDHTQMDMTVLFSDIRGYTPLSESMTPRQTFDFLNSYLSYISPVIRAHNGFINQYYGDGIMALFAGKPEDAIEAAIDLRQAVARFNGQRLEQGQHAIQIGIALHTSTLMLGTIGEDPRMTVTVIGDTVNTTARLEGLTKQYGVTILTTQETLQGLADPGNYHLRFLGKVQVKGKQQLLSIFEIFDGDDEVTLTAKKQTRLTFEAGLHHYQQGKFIAAFEHFDAVLAHLPSDSAAQLYQARAAHYTTYGVPAVWEGVDVLTQK